MYLSVPGSGGEDWVLRGVLMAGGVALAAMGIWLVAALWRPDDTVASLRGPKVPVRFLEARDEGSSVRIRVQNASGSREVSLPSDHPLAARALQLEPGTTIEVPSAALQR
jgi:hypothetical protein